jgi:hypothetical protein
MEGCFAIFSEMTEEKDNHNTRQRRDGVRRGEEGERTERERA